LIQSVDTKDESYMLSSKSKSRIENYFTWEYVITRYEKKLNRT
jgi:hypothetical protein